MTVSNDTSYGNFLLPYEVTLLYFLHFADYQMNLFGRKRIK